MGPVVATVVVAAAVLAATAGGVAVVAGVAVLVGLLATVDASRLLGRYCARPVLPAAAVPVVALPVVAANDAATTWTQVGGWYVATFVAATALLLLSGRRHGATMGLGATMAVAAVVGLGAGALVLLAALPSGGVWLVVVVLLAVAADVPDRLVGLGAHREAGQPARARPGPGAIAALGGVVFAAAALATALAPAASPLMIAAVAVTVLVADRVVVMVARSTPPGGAAPGRAPAPGGLLGSCGTLLLAAPVAYLVLRVGGS